MPILFNNRKILMELRLSTSIQGNIILIGIQILSVKTKKIINICSVKHCDKKSLLPELS